MKSASDRLGVKEKHSKLLRAMINCFRALNGEGDVLTKKDWLIILESKLDGMCENDGSLNLDDKQKAAGLIMILLRIFVKDSGNDSGKNKNSADKVLDRLFYHFVRSHGHVAEKHFSLVNGLRKISPDVERFYSKGDYTSKGFNLHVDYTEIKVKLEERFYLFPTAHNILIGPDLRNKNVLDDSGPLEASLLHELITINPLEQNEDSLTSASGQGSLQSLIENSNHEYGKTTEYSEAFEDRRRSNRSTTPTSNENLTSHRRNSHHLNDAAPHEQHKEEEINSEFHGDFGKSNETINPSDSEHVVTVHKAWSETNN